MALDVGWRATVEFEPTYPTAAVKAAVLVLLSCGGGPMYYRDIAAIAIARGLWEPDGDTPWSTLNSDIREDIKRAEALGRQSVFVRPPWTGMVSLAYSDVASAGRRIADASQVLRASLLDQALRLDPRDFENLVAELIRRMGYRDVVVTRFWGDGGVDITATFPCGPIAHQRFVFQVKRFRGDCAKRYVRELRGVLEDDERGVLISTGKFGPGPRRQAEHRSRPVVLVDGHQLAELFIACELGVERVPTEVLRLVAFPATKTRPARGIARAARP
jgi:restriction system protein